MPARIRLDLALLLPLLAGFGFSTAHERIETLSLPVTTLRAGGLPFFLAHSAVFCRIEQRCRIRAAAVIRWNCRCWWCAAGILLLAVNGRAVARGWRMAWTAAVADAAWTAGHWADGVRQATWLDAYAPLAQRLSLLMRSASILRTACRSRSPLLHLRLFGGDRSLSDQRHCEAVEQGVSVTTDSYSIALPALLGIEDDGDITQANRDAVIDTAVLGAWGVSHVVAAYPIDHDHLQLLDEVNGVYIYANTDAAAPLTDSLPDWAAGWENLPSTSEVERLNTLTGVSAAASGIAFVCCAAVLAFLKLRSHE
ncbi:MAG: hypothetical protein U0694_26990 [Anaerolineae bacterium]